MDWNSSRLHAQPVDDETQGQSNIQDCIVSGGLLGVYPLNPTVDKGPACFNIKNNWEINTLYHLPNLAKDNGFLSKVTNGWFLSSIISIQSGEPFSPIIAINRSNSGVAQAEQGDRVNINTPALLAAYRHALLCPAIQRRTLRRIPIPVSISPIAYNPNKVITGNPTTGSTALCSRSRRLSPTLATHRFFAANPVLQTRSVNWAQPCAIA